MLKTSESSSRPRELARGKDSVREKLRAKIRQRIHNPQFEEGDENVNILNREKAPRTQQERRKTAPVQNDKVIQQDSSNKIPLDAPEKEHRQRRHHGKRENKQQRSLYTEDCGSSVQTHKEKKCTPTERRERTSNAKDEFRDRKEISEEEHRSTHTKQIDKFESKGEGRRRRDKPLTSKDPKQVQSEKRATKCQKQTISSEKSDFLSSLVKLKDALQAQSKDHKKAAIKEQAKRNRKVVDKAYKR